MKNPDRFCALRFVTRYGYAIPWLGALFTLLAGFWLAYQLDSNVWAYVAIPAALLAYALIRLLVEVVDLVAETLLPR